MMAFEKGLTQRIGFTTRDATDSKTPTVPTTPVATWSKDGGAFAPATNAVSSIGGGACNIIIAIAETNCDLGKLRVTSDNCDQVDLDVYFEGEYTAARATLITTIGTVTAAIKVVTDKLAAMIETAGAAWRWTTAALVNAPGGGVGDFSIPLTVEDDAGDPVASARLTIPGLSAQTTGAGGTFDAEWPLNAGTYEVTILAGAGYTPSNPYSLVVAVDGSVTTPTGGAFVVPKNATPEPTPDGYCKVWCLAGTEGPDATTGTFYVSEVFSPEVYDPDGTPVEIVRGGTSMALVDGAAYRQVRQEAVVTFVLATPGKQKEWTRVVIPETAEEYVQNLLAEE
jgi:hypothetical protein